MNKTKEDAKKTNEQLLQAAYELFRIKGYEGTSLSEIATNAGMSRGAAYWHYKNKDAIYEEIIRRNLYKMLEQKLAISENNNISLIDKFTELLSLPLENINDYRMVTYTFDLINKYPQFTELISEIQAAKKRLYNIIFNLVQIAKEKGEVSKGKDTEITTDIIYFLFEGLYFSSIENKDINTKRISMMIKELL